jgi:hypothetical protein
MTSCLTYSKYCAQMTSWLTSLPQPPSRVPLIHRLFSGSNLHLGQRRHLQPATHTYLRTILPTPTTIPHQDSTSPTTTRSSQSHTASFLFPTHKFLWTRSSSTMTIYTTRPISYLYEHRSTNLRPHYPRTQDHHLRGQISQCKREALLTP